VAVAVGGWALERMPVAVGDWALGRLAASVSGRWLGSWTVRGGSQRTAVGLLDGSLRQSADGG